MKDFEKYLSAYGQAKEVAGLIEMAGLHPSYEKYSDEPYYSLWSHLWHQGDIYPASIIAVPYLIKIALDSPINRLHNPYHLAVSILITDKMVEKNYNHLKDQEFYDAVKNVKSLGIKLIENGSSLSLKRVGFSGLAYSVGDIQLASLVIKSDETMVCFNCDFKL